MNELETFLALNDGLAPCMLCGAGTPGRGVFEPRDATEFTPDIPVREGKTRLIIYALCLECIDRHGYEKACVLVEEEMGRRRRQLTDEDLWNAERLAAIAH